MSHTIPEKLTYIKTLIISNSSNAFTYVEIEKDAYVMSTQEIFLQWQQTKPF